MGFHFSYAEGEGATRSCKAQAQVLATLKGGTIPVKGGRERFYCLIGGHKRSLTHNLGCNQLCGVVGSN